MNKKIHNIILIVVVLQITFVMNLFSGEPLILTTTGDPFKWDNSSPIQFNPDGGGLGSLTNAEAVTVTSDAFQAWGNITTASLSFTNGGQITDSLGNAVDITRQNFSMILNTNSPLGQNSIVFDDTGEIFDLLFGPGSGILGFATPTFIRTSTPF
ncbi:MAG: hypothetical protein ACE5HS_21895 [bacterium]